MSRGVEAFGEFLGFDDIVFDGTIGPAAISSDRIDMVRFKARAKFFVRLP